MDVFFNRGSALSILPEESSVIELWHWVIVTTAVKTARNAV